ncbi:MAG TPA: nuclear transport factor 2 family protein [Rhizomicrobium sp.]|jgi:ketosteroid isomerase-like protein|nr:nuclear transport factor 2 family protein [Rhizomicrobium sp.]
MTPEEQFMKTLVEAWGHADMRPVFDALDDDIVWKSGSTVDDGRFRFGGEYRGRDSVLALLSKISTAYFFSEYETKEVVSKGEIVWGLFLVKGNYAPIASGKAPQRFAFDTAMRWRVRNGKVIEAQTFFDTAALLAQQGQLPLATD